MTKTFDSKKVMKSFLSKDEIRFAESQGWKIYPIRTINWYTHTTEFDDKKACEKACNERAKALRRNMANLSINVYIDGKYNRASNLQEWIKLDNERIKVENRLKREEDAIIKQLNDSGLAGVFSTIFTYRVGDNTDKFSARYGKKNSILCIERADGYCRSCKFTKIVRSFTLVMRKGWNVQKIGGLLTFYKGEFDRHGIRCEWIEQGRSINSFRTVSGFLVRGEHIEAKSLKEAQAINANHRAMTMARLLNARKRHERRQQQKDNGSLMITFADSLASGNCRPGTQQFKQQYEEVIGHEAKSISIADLRKYGKMFGVEYYAEKTIEYALNH